MVPMTPTNEVELLLSPTQAEFVDSKHENTLFSGGLGSGKTFGGAVWAALMPLYYPGANGLITANSYSQLRKATLSTYFEVLDLLGMPFVYKQQDSTIIVNDTKVFAMSMEKYDLLRGIEVG
jgi:phage terminase large subunit-like protein